jgi:hypothetical protein
VLGAIVVVATPALVFWYRRTAPAVAFAAGLAALSYLPTANLLFPSGVVLAERNLYLAVALPVTLVAAAAVWAGARWGTRPVAVATALLVTAFAIRSLDRLPSWRDNRSQLLTLLTENPESYRGHASAAAVLAGIGDTAGARREYRTADSLFPSDPYLVASRAIFLISIGDTISAAALVDRARAMGTGDRMVSRASFLLELARGNRVKAASVAAAASRRYQGEEAWYRQYR